MTERTPEMDLLFSMRDLGIPDPLPDSIDIAARAALTSVIHSPADRSPRRFGSVRGALRRTPLIPVAFIVTAGVAVAATGVATHVLNFGAAAKKYRHDTALQLFRADLPARSGASPASLWDQTVIPSSVRVIATPTVPGLGKVKYWVANTKQRGICTAIQLPSGSWAGMQNINLDGNSLAGCRPTRRQTGWGALILSGFDYTTSEVLTKSGKLLVLDYGEITAPGHPIEVRRQYGRATAPVIDGKYFLFVNPLLHSKLVALNAAGKVVANERKPLPGTPTTKCVGRYDIRRYKIPGTKRTSAIWSCRRYVRTIAK